MLVIKTYTIYRNACLPQFLRQISVSPLGRFLAESISDESAFLLYNRLVMLKFKVVRATTSSVHVTNSGYFYMTEDVNNMKFGSEKV